MPNVNHYNINGVKKEIPELTIEDLSVVIKEYRIDRGFLEDTWRYFCDGIIINLARSKLNRTEEVLEFFKELRERKDAITHRGNGKIAETYWWYLSEQEDLSSELLEKYQDQLDWEQVSLYVDYNIIKKNFSHKLDHNNIHWNTGYQREFGKKLLKEIKGDIPVPRPLTLKEYKRYVGENSSYLFRDAYLPKELLQYVREYAGDLEIYENPHLSLGTAIELGNPTLDVEKTRLTNSREITEDEMEKYRDYICWDTISADCELTDDIIRKYQNELNWKYISYYQNLSIDIIREFSYRIEAELIAYNEATPLKTLIQVESVVKNHIGILAENKGASEELVRKALKETKDDVVKRPSWDCISKNKNLSEDFIREHEHKLDMYIVFTSLPLKDELVMEYVEKYDDSLDFLLNNRTLKISTLEKLLTIRNFPLKF